MENKVYLKTETFRGPGSNLSPYQYVLIAKGNIFCSINHTYNTILHKLRGIAQLVEHKIKARGSILSGGNYNLHFFHLLAVTLSLEN